MSVKFGTSKISKIYYGTKQIKKIYYGTTLVYSAGGILKLTSSPLYSNTAIGMDDDYIYLAGALSSSTYYIPATYKINKATNEISQIVNTFTDNQSAVTQIRSNGSVVLFRQGNGNCLWYDKATDTCSSVFTTVKDNSVLVHSSCIDATHSYFGILGSGSNGYQLVRVNNSTKNYETFSCGDISPNQLISDGNSVYIYNQNGNCYVFNKYDPSFYLFAEAPSGITNIFGSSSFSNPIAQNYRYIFVPCMNPNGSYNQILATDKVNRTSSLMTAISEDTFDTTPEVACNEKYLFISKNSKIYYYDLAKNITKYTTVNMDKYTETTSSSRISIVNTVADEERLFLYTFLPNAVFELRV